MKFAILLFGLISLVAANPHPKDDDSGYVGRFSCNRYNCGCSNGNWIKRDKKCNGVDDCGDNSDEGESAGCSGDSCFSAGTKVTLASGEEIAIEKQMIGLNLISNAGDITTITSEYVENDIGASGQLFGINDDEPFATPNHPFWTTEGWKCLNPAAASDENPDIKYGSLQIGDIVFRIAHTTPLLYEPIRIGQLTIMTLSEPSKTFGLHLNGPQSYHANGYVVAANYPILTEKRVHDGMEKLSNGEKESLMSAIGSGKELTKLAGKWAKPAFQSAGPINQEFVADN